MPALYPLLILPEFYERLWGTRDLRPYFRRAVEGEPIGEAWLTGEDCKIANGEFAGRTLREVAAEYGASLTGDAAPLPTRFPLLIKFLFPRQKLSVQVHPDDERARRSGEACGKTECWYIARALPGASIGLGLRAGIDREMFRMAIEAQQAEHMLNWVEVHPGEMYYVDAGTVHALGANSIVIETQQNSDVTYRLYDYGRPRQLHLERGMEALQEKTHAGLVEPAMVDGRQQLVASPCFVVEKLKLTEPVALERRPGRSTVQVLVPIEGAAVLESAGYPPQPVMPGEALLIPAALDGVTLHPQWSAELLLMSLPTVPLAHPCTSLHTSSTTSHG